MEKFKIILWFVGLVFIGLMAGLEAHFEIAEKAALCAECCN